MMETILIVLLLILNFAISAFNAYAVGRGVSDAKVAGTWAKLMMWAGGTMSASGFTWVYLIVMGYVALAFGKLDLKTFEAMLSMGYLVLIIPILGSGLMIMVDSWLHFYRERSLVNGGFAAWNTFAQAYNTYQAVSAIPEAVKNAGGLFGDDDELTKEKVGLMILIIAILGGVITTWAIIRMTASSRAESMLKKKDQYTALKQ